MKKISMYLVLLASLFMSACAPTATSRSSGQVVDDVTMTARVKKEIGTSLGLTQAATINVDTYRGVVSLSGFVNDEQQMRAASQAAQAVPGVEKVFNNLLLKSKP